MKNSARGGRYFTEDFMEKLPLILIGFDKSGAVRLWNKSAELATGFKKKDVLKSKTPFFLHQLFRENSSAEFEDCETVLFTKNGELRDIVWNGFIMKKNARSLPTFIITGRDITNEKKASKQLKQCMTYDSHTGLVNYRFFTSKLNHIFRRSFLENKPVSLLLIEMNYFQSINRTYGVSTGNEILRQFAQLLRDNADSTHIVSRFSGTQFAVLMPSTDIQKAFKYAGRLFSNITSHDFKDKSGSVKVNVSICMALGGYPHCQDVCTAEQLMDRIFDKLNEAKKNGAESVLVCSTKKMEETADPDKQGYLADSTYRYTMEFVSALANAVRIKDFYTQEHSSVMVNYAAAIAEEMGMSAEEVRNVRMGALLHDLGKIGVDRSILLKPGPLTPTEFSVVKHHPRIGAEIIRNVHPLKDVVPYVLYHHERWDGKGYPNGLKGEEIPLGARIISLSDVFQALTTDRPYRKSMTEKEALSVIRSNSGKRFDPAVVSAFFKVYKGLRE